MYEELARLLEGRCSPELSQTLLSLEAIMAKGGFTKHRVEIDHLITIVESLDSAIVVPTVTEVLRQAAEEILRGCGVEVNAEIPLLRLFALVDAIIGFGPNIFFDRISDIIENEVDPVEAFCQILPLLTQYSAEEYHPYITDVSEKLLTNIREQIEVYRTEELEEPEEISEETKTRIAAYRNKGGDEFLDRVIADQMPLGTSMESSVPYYTPALVDLPIQTAVKALVTLGIYSEVSTESLQDEVAHYIESIYPDVESNQKANQALRNEIAALESLLKG